VINYVKWIVNGYNKVSQHINYAMNVINHDLECY